MIKNQRQYTLTKGQIEQFESTITEVGQEKSELHPMLAKAQLDALVAQKEELEEQVQEYELLTSGQYRILEVDTIKDLPLALIRSRIALGLTQKDLAERLGLKEQQIQRYENTNYASTSFTRLISVIEALDLKVREDVFLPFDSRKGSMLLDRLQDIGLDKNFIEKRVAPERHMEPNSPEWLEGIVTILERVFGWSKATLLGDKPLAFGKDASLLARFKMPANTRPDFVSAYTVYAHYLAGCVLQCAKEKKKKKLINDPLKLRGKLIEKYSEVTFASMLDYVWSTGTPVLALNDSGAFHGATWRKSNRNIIVLKQKSHHLSKWCFDLIHEFYHAGSEQSSEEFSTLEASETSTERRTSPEEIAANEFATNVLLGERADEIIRLCFKNARGRISWLKSSVERVADQEGIDVGVLAYQVANVVEAQPKKEGKNFNWWGAANNLQVNSYNPRTLCVDYLRKNLDTAALDCTDQEILERALGDD